MPRKSWEDVCGASISGDKMNPKLRLEHVNFSVPLVRVLPKSHPAGHALQSPCNEPYTSYSNSPLFGEARTLETSKSLLGGGMSKINRRLAVMTQLTYQIYSLTYT